MASTTQIIPEFLHPHVKTYINDNTTFTEQVADTPSGVRFISVFTSGKGRDGVLLHQKNPLKYLEEYGRPNFNLYGQPGYMPYQALVSNQAEVWTMRVMPDDALYANVVILAKVKTVAEVKDPDSGIVKTPGSVKVHFVAEYLPDVADKNDFAALVDLLTDLDPDSNGYQTYPLFVAYSLGRGQYGNGFRLRVNSAPQADKDNDYKNYRFEVLELENTITRKELFTGAVYFEALDGTRSLYIEDLINDSEAGSSRMNVYVVQESFEAIRALYQTANSAHVTDIKNFDVITGKTKAGTAIPAYTIEVGVAESVALDTPDGIPLSGGDDGAFKLNPESPSVREEAINNAYIKAFSGDYDRAILSKRRTPAELILDAGYSDEVKRALIGLITKRYDAFGIIDGGILNSLTDAIEWGTNMYDLGDRVLSKEFQHYKVRDPFTGKIMPVTITYLYANKLPAHFSTNGNQRPFVGEAFAKLTGAIKNSLAPVVDADDDAIKEQLYNLRLNYFQAIAENTYVRGTGGTSQTIWSDLSEENNMHVLLEMKRLLENMVSRNLYDFAEQEDRNRFTEDADRLFEPFRGVKCREAEIEFSMTPWEETRSILHCNLAVVFRTVAKRGIIEIDVNPRA